MVMTAMEARSNVCLLVLVNCLGSTLENCRPEECSAWSCGDDCDASGNRLGYCVLAGPAARPRPKKRKIS
jgi:hypothetical protein